MASGIFVLLDDIALLADDMAMASKVATKKTAAILGDDLAVNAQNATGFDQSRELKVIWAITKGSLLNKVIILPLAFLLSIFAPSLIAFILIFGGLYLLYEGFEKVEEYFHRDYQHEKELLEASSENILEVEKQKIKAAIMTDFILSLEIVFLALGTVLDRPLMVQMVATTVVAFVATVGVYGLVAFIVRIDNIGFTCIDRGRVACGNFLVALMPKIIKALSLIGTVAMFAVGGGILSHNIAFFHDLQLHFLPSLVNDMLIGLLIGYILVKGITYMKYLFKKGER